MASVKCPYCDQSFDWTRDMGEGRVQCPLCGKTMKVQRRTGTQSGGTRAKIDRMTNWGTQGFGGDEEKDEYGEIRSGDELGGFRIEEMVGAGAMAVVYRATQLSLGRSVALKILPRRFSRRESFVRQFDSETELLASLNHPNIVTIIDRGREGETYYFAMEFIEGTTLGELAAADKIDVEFFLQIMEQCGEALSYAHSKGIIHRDIKPANIMLNEQGVVKVADFGVAGIIAEARKDGKRRVMGTRGYMPPEQEVSVDRTDERSDIFSLGAVMYRVLADRIPDQLPPLQPSKVGDEVDPRLDHIVLKCLEANPDRRYQSAQELLDALKAFHNELSRAHELCPKCKKPNPPSQMECVHCGADLSEMFDACPECGEQNRMDMDICMSCGVSLTKLRQETSVHISQLEERARDYAMRHRFDAAIAEMQEVLTVKGKIFQKARERAGRAIKEYRAAEKNYNLELVEKGKRQAEKGQLNRAISTLETVPEQYAKEQGVSQIIVDIKCRMMVAKKKLEETSRLLADGKLEEAEKAFAEVESTWSECPGIEEVRRQVKAARDTEQMLEYELEEVRELLQEGKVSEARAAIQFAQSTSPDSPAVKKLLAEIERRAEMTNVRQTIREGREAFDQGSYSVAVRLWTSAAEHIPEDDERHAKLRESISVARKNMLEHDVVLLEEAEPVVLRSDPGKTVELLIAAVVCLVLAVVLAGAVRLSMGVALAGARPDFMLEVEFNEAGLLSTNFMGWPTGDPPASILTLHSDRDNPPEMRIARPAVGTPLASPTGTKMLNIWGWRSADVVLAAYNDLSYVHVVSDIARGPTNGHDRFGLVAHHNGPEDKVSIVYWPGNRVTLISTGQESFHARAGMVGPGGEQIEMPMYEFWTLEMKTEPGTDDGTLKVSFKIADANGAPKRIEPEPGERNGEYQGAWWVVDNVPLPAGGLQGTAGVHCAVANSNDEDRGLWVDSILVQRLRQNGPAADSSPGQP